MGGVWPVGNILKPPASDTTFVTSRAKGRAKLSSIRLRCTIPSGTPSATTDRAISSGLSANSLKTSLTGSAGGKAGVLRNRLAAVTDFGGMPRLRCCMPVVF